MVPAEYFWVVQASITDETTVEEEGMIDEGGGETSSEEGHALVEKKKDTGKKFCQRTRMPRYWVN